MFTIISAAVRGFRVWQERQRVLNELYAMDDRSLADIGLRRADIPFAVVADTADIVAEARPVFTAAGHVAANSSIERHAA
jgi:uncharacterized protein YjiS (DUF1127 family)